MAKRYKQDYAVNTKANAPSQAHLQGTQSRHTKANLAKEPALFLRFLGHTLSNRTQYAAGHTPTKGERTVE
jgi:hypothetical protein